MRAHNHLYIAAAAVWVQGRAPQALDVVGICRAGVYGDKARIGVAHQIAVGAGSGHEAGVGRGQALHIAQQGHGFFCLPVQCVVRLMVAGANQGQFAKRHVVLQEVGGKAGQHAHALSGGGRRLLIGWWGVRMQSLIGSYHAGILQHGQTCL